MSRFSLENTGGFGPEEDAAELTNLLDPIMALVGLLAAMVVMLPALNQLNSRLAEASGETYGAETDSAVLLGFNRDGDLTWCNEPLPLAHLEPRLVKLAAEPGATVLLAGDQEAPYGLSLRIRSLLGKHGVAVRELSRDPLE